MLPQVANIVVLILIPFLLSVGAFPFQVTLSTVQTTVEADGVTVFYRSAGNPSAPVLLLLHGFPTSSFQYRNLIPLLARRYRVIAPDYPGFGFTEVPENRSYNYTFDNLATTIEAFVDVLKIKKFAVYMFDYGAPVGLRLATRRPSQITALISQNGNAYTDGLDPTYWGKKRAYWISSPSFDPTLSSPAAQALLPSLQNPAIQGQYTTGVPAPLLPSIDPATYTLDAALMARFGQLPVAQFSLFFDYQNNVALYPTWQEYFRKDKPRLLAMWGENDVIFLKAGALAFKRDLPDAEVVLVDSGHFPLETHVKEYAERIDQFLRSIL